MAPRKKPVSTIKAENGKGQKRKIKEENDDDDKDDDNDNQDGTCRWNVSDDLLITVQFSTGSGLTVTSGG